MRALIATLLFACSLVAAAQTHVNGGGSSTGGGATSVTNVDGTLVISPTTGAVVASLNTAANIEWTGNHVFDNPPTLVNGFIGQQAALMLLNAAPSGACGVIGWTFSIDSRLTYCNGTTYSALVSAVVSGSTALHTAAIASLACDTTTATATGAASTSAVTWLPNASIKAVTGYTPSLSGGLSISAFPSSGQVNFDVCNWTSASITPGAVTVNWSVVR